MMRIAIALLFSSAYAFAPVTLPISRVTPLFSEGHIGAGGMADTRNPDALEHEDPRKSIAAAPSFEEYLKNRDGGGAAPAETPAAPSAAPIAPAATAPAPAASLGDAISTLDASQKTTLDKITAAIAGLEQKPDLSWSAEDGEKVAGCSATIDGREAPGAGGNVGWLASVCVESKMSSLTIFNGPLTNVPHLLSRACIFDDNKLSFVLDFRPRAYGAYEMKDSEGNYPGPDELGRDAFTYSGNRMEFDNNFGVDELVDLLDNTLSSLEGAVSADGSSNELDSLTSGPLKMDVTMPLTDGNVAAVAAAREKAADFWLGWATSGDFDLRPGAPINSQYVYDTKYKQNAYGALLPVYGELFGADDGAKLTAAESGPLDEAYVGGGS